MSKPEIRCIQGRYSVWMNDKCIRGGIFTEGEAKSYLASYEEIYYAGFEDGAFVGFRDAEDYDYYQSRTPYST